jgi:hypothetical protein
MTIDSKNEQALAMAYRRAVAKSLKIKELEITPEMADDPDAVNAMVKFMAERKAEKEGTEDWKQFVKGQRWYVEDLVAFSRLTAQERLDLEYKHAFPDIASEAEMLNSLAVIC